MKILLTICLLLGLYLQSYGFDRNKREILDSSQNTDSDEGIPSDWIEESPINQNNGNKFRDFPLPDGIPAESEDGNEDNDERDLPKTTKTRRRQRKTTMSSKKKSKTVRNGIKLRSNEELTPEGDAQESPEASGQEPPKGSGQESPKGSGQESPEASGQESPEASGQESPKGSGQESPETQSEVPVTLPKDIPKLVEICDKPVVINAANRFANSTVRLFRDNSFWDLMGLPDRQAFTSAKTSLSAPMAPVPPKTSIVTILEGSDNLKGKTYKFQKQFFWVWDEEDKQVRGGRGGEFWSELPKDGFDTMFHNGNQSKPMIIGFKDELVYYLSTKDEDLEFIDPEGKKGGKFKENFPPGLTASFTWPLEAGLKVYLFREDKYCMRDVGTPLDGKDCAEWRETFELFGCIETQPPTTPTEPTTVVTEVETSTEMLITEAETPPPPPPPPPPPLPQAGQDPTVETKPPTVGGGGTVSTIGFASLLVAFLFIL